MEQDQVVTPQTGATTEERSLASGFHDQRAKMLEQLAERVDAAFNERVQAEPQPEPQAEPEKIEATPEPQAQVEAEPEKIKLTIYGKEQEVPKEEVLEAGRRALQKQMAADKTLEEAAKLKKEVEQLKQEIERSRSLPQEVTGQDAGRQVQDWVTAIRYGTEEEATKAFAQAMDSMRPRETFDPSQLNRIVDQRLTEAQIRNKFAAPKDQGGFEDLTKDPYLLQIATVEAEKLIQSGANPGSWDTYVEAGRKTREWRDRFVASTQPIVDPIQEKAEKKKQIDTVPSASARTVTGNKEPEREPTASEVIESMRRARPGGQ